MVVMIAMTAQSRWIIFLKSGFELIIGGESLIWVGYHNLGQLLAPKQIELENPATSQIEDSSKAFPTVI